MSDYECPICYRTKKENPNLNFATPGDYYQGDPPCSHYCCRPCIVKMCFYSKHSRCPLCRSDWSFFVRFLNLQYYYFKRCLDQTISGEIESQERKCYWYYFLKDVVNKPDRDALIPLVFEAGIVWNYEIIKLWTIENVKHVKHYKILQMGSKDIHIIYS